MDAFSIHLVILAFGLLAFGVLWPISVARSDASVVDVLWGPGFGLIVWAAWALTDGPSDPRSLALVALITAWSARLGAYMIGRKAREPHEDPRYTDLRRSWEPGFWWKSLFVVFLLQGFLQWLMTMPAQRALMAAPAPMDGLAFLAIAVALTGLGLETVADGQLKRFRAEHGRTRTCRDGLWAWSRHPNYFGEILFWWGVWGLCWPAAEAWTIIGPIVLTLLLRYVSGVPMLEEHMARTRRDYEAYRRETPMLLPRRPRNSAESATTNR